MFISFIQNDPKGKLFFGVIIDSKIGKCFVTSACKQGIANELKI